MAGDKFDQLYNALKADGAVSGTREHFRQFVYAPGKQGYQNRKQLYDALHADGAVSSNSYEEFAQRLGLHAVNPKPQQKAKPVQPVKKQTMKERAQEVAAQYQKPRQQKAQQPSTATASGTDYMQNWQLAHMRNDQMTPMQQVQASNMRARMQRAQEESARQEQQRATPISRSRITPTAKNFNETMQQLSTPEAKQARAKQQREDDARTLAQYEVEGNKFVRNDGQTKGILANDLLSLVDSSMNEAQELTRQQYQQNLDKMGGIYAPQSVKEQAFRDAQTQEQVNRQNVLMNNLSSKINEIYSQKGMQRHIAESAEKLNMSVEEYVDKYVTPEIMNYAQKALTMRNQEEIMPHGALDYIAKNLSNSIIGMVVAPSVMSRDTRQRLQEGIAIADGDAEIQKVAGHKDETYRSGIGTRFASTAVNMAADSGPLAVIGAGASAVVNTGTRVLTNGLVKAGVMKAAQKLTAQQMAFKVANMTTAQKIMSGLGTRTATSSLNLAGYSGVTAALSQASTGDDTSLQAIGEAGLKGAEHGAVTGAMFGVSGAVMSPWVSKFGITGMEKSTGERLLHGAQKFGATAAGLGVEAGTMMVADNVTGDKDISFGTWLEDVVMVGAFKAGEPSNFVKMGNVLHHLTHNSGGNFVIGKNANGSPIAVDIRLTADEKNELINSASGKNLMDAFVKVDRASKTAPRDPKYKTVYTDFMNDPDVSQSTKEKVNAAMGLFNTTRGKSYRSVNDVKNKQILEYTKNGTLLTRTSYKNADERRAVLYKQKLYRDNDDMMSLMGYARMKDMQLTDEDGNVTKLALGFLRDNGYDINKDASDPNNARLINELRNQKSALYLDWMKYADKNGLLGYLRSESRGVTNNFMASIKELFGKEGSILIDIDKIMRKDPMKRTDEENRIFYHVKKALEDELFPSWRPHADQSASQGKTVAEEHSLGTDNPDSGVVVDELRNLRNAEQALDAAMDSNDVFKQTFEQLHQQGLTPAQIYDALIQNGLTEEELTPLAQYINANARVQGMQQATADAINENVKDFVSDWSYHGTLNGQPMNGEQALYVQDSNGRTLLVGSGDVAFDQTTGRAKEGSGDMLVCLDPNTKEMVYVKADEVTLFQNQPLDQFVAEQTQRLQMKNSEPYNQAAQEQAMLDAAKAQEKPQDNTTKSEDSTTNEDLAPQEQPQQKDYRDKLADLGIIGTDESPAGGIKNNPENGAESRLTKAQEALIEKKVERVLENPDSTIADLHDAIVFKLNNGDRSSANTTVLDAIYKVFDAYKRGEISKEDVLNFVKEQFIGEEDNPLRAALEAKRQKSGGSPAEQPQQEGEGLKFKDGTSVPVDANGEPDFLKMTPEQGAEVYKMLFEEDAPMQIESDIKTLEKDLQNVKASKYEGSSVMERAAARKKVKEAIALAEAQVEKAKAIKAAMEKKPEAENAGVGTAENAGQYEKERQQGYREGEGGVIYHRQKPEEVGGVRGKEVTVAFSPTEKVAGHVKLVELDTVQASHNNGQLNLLHFGPDWQPKDRSSQASRVEAEKIAGNIDPEQITGSNNAFIGSAPSVNERHETIQGNNRVDALKEMYASHPEQAAKYKQWLIDHAAEFGLNAEDIKKMKKPVIVNELPVDDATAKKLGQMMASGFESGGKRIPEISATINKLGDKMENLANVLLSEGTLGEDAKLSDLINQNSKRALEFLNKNGFIDNTEYENLATDVVTRRQWLESVLKASLFDGNKKTEAAFNTLPGNAQKAVLATFMRDRNSKDEDRIKENIQKSFEAYNELNQIAGFKNAKNLEQARAAIQAELLNGSNNMFGEAPIREKYTKFELELAALYKGLKDQKSLTGLFGKFYDAIQGKVGKELDAFSQENAEPLGKDEAIENVFGINNKQENDRRRETESPSESGGGNGSEPAGDRSAGAERPRVEEPDDLVNKELESRIKVTDEETETPSKNGPIMKQKIVVDGDKEVMKVDEPNEKGEYTGSYYKFDGKKFGDLKEVADYIDSKKEEGPLPLLPKEENPDPTFDPIAAAAAEFKKEHPLTEEEIMKADVDDLSKDMALDYLNGEVTDDLHRAIYESIFAKTRGQKTEPKVETPKKEPSADPMEGIKKAAEGFEKEKKAKVKTEKKPQQTADDAAVEASNKKVNDLWDMLKNAGKDEMSASFIGLNSRQLEVLPKLVSAMAENAYLRIKRGMHNLEDVVKEMRKEFAPAAKLFKKEDVDAIYEQMMNIRYRDGEQRMSLKDWADYYEKTSPKHQENLVGDSKTAEERKLAEKKFIDTVKLQLAFGRKFKSIVELRKMAERLGLKDVKDTDLQELAETAIVQRARSIAASEATDNEGKFKRIVNLYENQPSLNQRDSERVMKQQYSTPAPYAFLTDMYVKGNGKVIESALEPSAGNGMLTIGLPMDKVHVNDIDAQRLANLRRQGFKNVTSQDGAQPFADKDVDVVVTNPPFGSATPKEYDGYKISSLEGQMAINALESMKDDGRAAIIIGGKTEYAKNGSLNPKDKAFLGYLYSHYNVDDVINVDGGLYAKQGTSYPTRIILINGRRNYDPEHKVFPPVEKDARVETVKDYDELYKRIEDDILRSTEQPVDIRRKEKREGDKPSGRENVSDSTEENGGRGRLGTSTVHDGTPENSEPTELDPSTRPVGQSEDADGRPVKATGNGDSNTDGRGGQTSGPKSGPADGGSGRGGNEPSGGNEPLRNGNGENGREPGVRHGSGHIQQPLDSTPKEEKKQSLTTEKVKYQPHSAAYSIGAVVPARQKEALDNVLNKLGDADQYLVDNLGYNDKEDLYAHLAAEQIDAVALGLKQMEKGNGFIIGDQTGIGKGRQAAAIIRYAVKQGRIPISFTQKANLFSDTYRDLSDVGSPELRPFILASSNEGNIKVNYDEEVKGLDGQTTTVRKQKVVYKVPSKTETERVLKYIAENGKLPEGYDYILTTYSQIRNGMEEWKGGKWKAKKKVTATDRNGQMKRDAIKRIAENSVFILDESHDAAGEGSGSAFIQDVLPKVKGVTFLSATYAKTPDAMKLYALKTDLGSKSKEEGEKGDASWKVLNAIKKGGAVFQEIMSQALTKSGQMIRRERDMTGVTIDWNPLTENEVEIQGQRDKFDNIFGIFNDILNFQRTYVDAKLGQMSDDLAFIQGSVDHTPGTKDMGIGNVTFASKAYNVVQQALFSIKAEKVADYAIEAIKNGEKPVIAVNNTMGSMIDEYPMGVEMDMPDLNSTLMKGLEGILRYTEKNDMGDQVNSTLRVEELGEEAVARYNEIKEKIASVSSGLSISPIDVIKHRLEEAGYKVGELTGRNTEMVYTENGKVIRKNRTDKNKNALADRFNNGDLDALILNRSAAAGISLHASSKYKDQRQRTMIFAQMQGNINDEVQIRGRIDRTGQVRRGKYVYLVSAIPAEQRLMMMFKNKLKSLDANTTSSQKSKFNEVDVQDFTNKYGDEIVLQYMAQHPEYYNKLADPLGWGFMEYAKDGLSIGELKSGMKPNITSPAYEVMKRLTLLPVKEQEVVLKDISDSYSQKIKQLNDMGMNDLEMTDMPLEAKTLKREVWKEGSDPNGDNAFADNTYIETVEMNVLRKPMKAEEVEDAQKKMLDGKDYETWRKDKIAEIRAAQQAKIEETKAKMEAQAEKKVAKLEESTRLALEKENAKIQKKLDKGEELKPGEHILTEEEIKTRVDTAVDDVKRRLSKKLSDAIENVNVKYDMFVNPLFAFDPNKTISVPNDWYMEEASTSLYPEFGRVIGFKYDKNYNLDSSSIVIATTDSRKRVEIPLNRPAVFERIQSDSERFSKECKVVNMDAWDRLIPKKDRTTGRIITGNMLEALADNSSVGHLISYTTDDGKVKQGILVPDSVSTTEITGNMPIAKAYNWLTKKSGGTELVSTDGTLRLTKNFDSMYTLFVPASRKDGGKYYLNQDLLNLVHGHNFQSKGNKFWATFDSKDLHDVLYVLNKMDVEVKTPNDYEESKTHFREDRGLQYSKTDTKDVKKGRIIPEDVDKNVSSQIEKKFDSTIEDIVEHAEDRDKSRLIDDADLAVEEFSNLGRSVIEYYINDYERKVEKLSGLSTGGRNGGNQDGKGNRGSYLLQYYKTILAVADRELAYRDARAKNLRETWGLQPGGTFLLGDVERIFKETNRDKEKAKLFQKVLDINKRLGVNIKVSAESPNKRSGEADTYRNIDLYIDGLTKTKAPDYAAPTVMLHEMIHEATMGAINLVKKGRAEGMLTPKQIEGVKTILEIYDRVKGDKERFKEEPYGLTDAYELTAQMADSRQRKAMDLSIWDRVMNAAHEFARRGDRSILLRVKDAIKKLFEVSDKDKMDKAINDIMDDFNETIDDISMNEIEQDGFSYKVTDKDELDRLNKEKTFRMYSGMQEVDGKLYSPMAAIIDGKRTDATEIGAWMGADERPDLVKNGKFQLVKTDKNPGAGEGPVPAAYNPYMHTSTSVMNDQFSGAYARGNIKVVEWEIPESEKTSGYHAEGAKNSVGLVPWTSGTVNSLLPKDRQRSVMLSRWRKAVRILPDEEVAEKIADQLRGTGLAIPWNVVTPSQLRELVKLGVPITTVEQGRQNPETKEKFLQQMAELEQEFPQAKFVNVKMTKDAYKEWGKNGGTKFRTDHGDGNYSTSSVESHVEKVAQKTGAKVNIVSSVDEITNKAAKAAVEEGRKITGWYDEKTGEVLLYMPNIHDRYTAEKTIWHEVVGHKGMRELFGDERFDKFLREVWYDLDKPENAALKKLVDEERKFNPLNIYDAIEEGIARLAEDGKGEPGFWNGIKNKVSDFLHEIGYRVAPNTKDVKYLLWLSKNLQKNPNDPYWKLRAEAVKYRLDHERVPAVEAHDGMFYGNDGKVRSMDSLTKSEWNEATDGQIHFRTTPSAGTALDRYHRSLDEHGYMFTESYMDNMLSLKKLMNAIVPDKKIEDIASSENPYILQNTMQGAMSDAAQMFERNVMKPLDKAMAGVLDAFDGKKDDEKIRNFNLYMITKHGLERNRVFFVRDFLRKMRMDEQKKQDADILENRWSNEKERLDNELNAGNIDLKEYYRQMDEFISNEVDPDYKAGEHDYSGIHAIQEVAKSSDPYDDAEAIQSVMDSEAKMESIKKGAVKDYWDKVKAATQYSIDSDYKNGIISRELHGHVSNMFNWYVPLRKYDEATAEDTYGYITELGDPKSYIGSTIMRARGHKYLSETNVLAQIGAMGNRAIKNGGMNAIRQAFARFARNNSGNNLITETSVWYETDPMTGIVYERYPDIPEDATADEINQIVSDFNTDMKAKAAQGLASKVYRRGNIGYKFQRAENKSQHIVDVKIAGKTHTFIINGNPRAAQALNGLLENSGAKGIMKPLSSISRMMAQLCTSYNPEFVMRNIMRDAEFASSNVTSKEGARYGALWAKYYAQLGLYKGASNISLKDLSGTTGLGLFAKYRNGTLDTSDKVQRYFKEFMENGGETGWVQIKNMKDWTKEYKKDVKGERSKIDKGGAALRDFFFGNLANVNEVAENIARFATYCTSRDSNRSIIRSVYDAKEVSTNFNRHGSGDAIKSFKNGEMTGSKAAARWAYGFTASYLRHCSMFFNAGIQSTNLLVKNLKNHPVGTSINMLAIPFALGALAALGNNVLIASEDEKDRKGVKDPYGELPDYVRRNNLCIYKGGGQFVTIPLAIELRAFYGLGDLAAGLTFSPNVSGQKNPYFDAVGCMSQLVPVMDYLGNSSAGKEPLKETIKAISPSALSPFVEWEMNTDWKGAPIERRGDWNENSPAWQRAYKSVPDGYLALNKFVNAQTNDVAKGNEDMLGNSFLDMVTNPSMLNHYLGGLGGGAATFTERAIGVVKHGSDTETKDIPFVRSLLYTPSEQSSLQRTKSKWYNYKDEMEKTMANVDRLKSKNVPLDKRITNIGEYFHFQNSKEAAKVRIIDLAEKQMKRWKKMRDKSSDTESINFANQNIDRIMMDAVDELDRLE